MESVELTALFAAAARAVETRRPDGLVRDQYAEEFVRAAGSEVGLPSGCSLEEAVAARSRYIGMRSRFFDLFCMTSAARGIAQAVFLATGLDTRALRLNWPTGCTVFEIDHPGVLEFKDRVLAGRCPDGAARVVVAVDLRENWPAALLAAGFDPGQPSAWLGEGVLPYLPPEAVIDLFERINELSSRGSRIAVESPSVTKAWLARQSRELSTMIDINLVNLIHIHNHEEPGDLLSRQGWSVNRIPASDFAAAYDGFLNEEALNMARKVTFFEGTRL